MSTHTMLMVTNTNTLLSILILMSMNLTSRDYESKSHNVTLVHNSKNSLTPHLVQSHTCCTHTRNLTTIDFEFYH